MGSANPPQNVNVGFYERKFIRGLDAFAQSDKSIFAPMVVSDAIKLVEIILGPANVNSVGEVCDAILEAKNGFPDGNGGTYNLPDYGEGPLWILRRYASYWLEETRRKPNLS